ncbi:MAG: hemolysin family protein [Candidatus Aminicenantes bacterium]|nr:hemolysin family protein [Candidatus Aminicenantes bacterium]
MAWAAYAAWTGMVLCFLAGFFLSLFHMAVGDMSKIAMSRYLEDQDRAYRTRILDRFEEIKLAADVGRVIFVLAFFITVDLGRPGLHYRPLLWVVFVLGVYAVVFDAVPRILAGLFRERLLGLFLPSHRILLALSAPALLLTRWLIRREEIEEAAEEDREASDEEIETFLDEAQEEGIIEHDEHELMRSVVEFGDTVVREIMTPRVDMVCIRRDASLQKLRNLIIAEKYSRIPVYRDRVDNVEGVAMAKDLLPFGEREHDAAPLDALLRPAVFVPESMKVTELLKEFRKVKQKMAIVVDEHGGVSGLVTMEDVMEELVGEIQDEYDAEEAQIVTNAPDDITASGDVKVEELEDLFDLELAGDDFITASGLIAHALGRLPIKGEVLTIKGLRFEALEVDPKRIKKVRIRLADPGEAEPQTD